MRSTNMHGCIYRKEAGVTTHIYIILYIPVDLCDFRKPNAKKKLVLVHLVLF